MSRPHAPLRTSIGNGEIIGLALYQLGGAGEFVDVEDIFLRSYELAPKRFSWRTRPFPNYKTLYKALVDLERAKPEALLKTSDGLKRQLSAHGVGWVRSRLTVLDLVLGQSTGGMSVRRPAQRLLNELAASATVQDFLSGGQPALTRYQAADLLIAAPDSPPEVWVERLAIYKSAAEGAGRDEIKSFLDFLEASHPEWFRA